MSQVGVAHEVVRHRPRRRCAGRSPAPPGASPVGRRRAARAGGPLLRPAPGTDPGSGAAPGRSAAASSRPTSPIAIGRAIVAGGSATTRRRSTSMGSAGVSEDARRVGWMPTAASTAGHRAASRSAAPEVGRSTPTVSSRPTPASQRARASPRPFRPDSGRGGRDCPPGTAARHSSGRALPVGRGRRLGDGGGMLRSI